MAFELGARGEFCLQLLQRAEEYARRRRQHRKIRLAWRKSRGARRSLGWIPFKVRTIRYRGGDERNKASVGSILDRSVPSLGIDLGLRTFAAFTDEALPPIEAERFYRDLEPLLARAQRARNRNRTRAIHAKIANRRRDFLHNLGGVRFEPRFTRPCVTVQTGRLSHGY